MVINQLLDFSWFNWKILLQLYVSLSVGLSIFNLKMSQRETRIVYHHSDDIIKGKDPSQVKKRFIDNIVLFFIYAIVIMAAVQVSIGALFVYLGLGEYYHDGSNTSKEIFTIHALIAMAIIFAMYQVSSKFHRIGLSKGYDFLDIYLFILVKMMFLFILSMLFPRWVTLSVKADMTMDALKSYHYVRSLNIFYVIFIEMFYGFITANIMPARTTYERIFEGDASNNRVYCFLKYNIYRDDTLGRHNDAKVASWLK